MKHLLAKPRSKGEFHKPWILWEARKFLDIEAGVSAAIIIEDAENEEAQLCFSFGSSQQKQYIQSLHNITLNLKRKYTTNKTYESKTEKQESSK